MRRPRRKIACAVAVVGYLGTGFLISAAVGVACAIWSPANPLFEAGRTIRVGESDWSPTEAAVFAGAKADPDPMPRYVRLESLANREWMGQYASTRGTEYVSTLGGLGVRIEVLMMMEAVTDGSAGSVTLLRAGWPCSCTFSHRWLLIIFEPPETTSRWFSGFAVPECLRARRDVLRGYRAVPYGIIWPGMFLNALVFGSAAWLVRAGPGALRRAMRRRAGCCVTCGYDARGLAPQTTCPECGTPPLGGKRT